MELGGWDWDSFKQCRIPGLEILPRLYVHCGMSLWRRHQDQRAGDYVGNN